MLSRLHHVGVLHLAASSHPAALVLTSVRVLPPRGLNTSIYLDLNHFARQTAWAHGFMHSYALWLGPVLLAAVWVATYVLAWWQRAPRATMLLGLGAIGTLVALGLNQLIGHAAAELRPYVTHPHALVLVGKTGDYAFPSDHSVVAGGLTVAVLVVLGGEVWRRAQSAPSLHGSVPSEKRGSPAAVRALAVVSVVLGLYLCFARVYVGAHYPGDVIAGYLLAAFVVLLFSMLRPLAYRVVDLIEPSILAILLRRPPTAGALGPGSAEASPSPTMDDHEARW